MSVEGFDTYRVQDAAEYEVSIPQTEGGYDSKGVACTWYLLKAKRRADGREVSVHRRFANFHALDAQLQEVFSKDHMRRDLPQPPPRTFIPKFLLAVTDPKTVARRRIELQNYLVKLVNFRVDLPRAASMIDRDFLSFLGFDSEEERIREISIAFPEGPLGVTLTQSRVEEKRVPVKDKPAVDAASAAAGTESKVPAPGGNALAEIDSGTMLLKMPMGVKIKGFKDGDDGKEGFAQRTGLLSPNDEITKINGEDVADKGYEYAVSRIKASKRPLIVHAVGFFSRDNVGSLGEASAAGDAAAKGSLFE